MRILEKITLIIYSYIMLIISIILSLLIFGWLDFNTCTEIIHKFIVGGTSSNVILAVCVAFILLSIKCIFFDTTSKQDIRERQGVLLENDNGRLMISQDTIENLVNSVVKNFGNVEKFTTDVILDKEKNVDVSINLEVKPGVIIKELSSNLQEKIKDTIKSTTDLDVKAVNIKIRNIVENKEETNM